MLQQFLVTPLHWHAMSRVALLHPELRAGDILVGDPAFGTFADLALLMACGLHGVFRISRRAIDFTTDRPRPPRWNTGKLTGTARSQWVRALGPEDQVVARYKPYVRSAWMTAKEHDTLPESLTIRECRYYVSRAGFRVSSVTL